MTSRRILITGLSTYWGGRLAQVLEREGLENDKALVQTVAHEVRARIQENVFDMVQKRRDVWFG